MAGPIIVNVSNGDWAIVAAALGAGLIGIVGSIAVERQRNNLTLRRSRETEMVDVCSNFVASAMLLSYRAVNIQWYQIARSNFTDSIQVALHNRQPIDPQQMAEYLGGQIEPLYLAQARLWSIGDREIISQANIVVLAANDVLGNCRVEWEEISGSFIDKVRSIAG